MTIGYVLVALSVVELLFGINIIRRRPLSEIKVSFFSYILVVVVWVASNGLIRVVSDFQLINLNNQLSYVAGILIALSLYYFTGTFPFRKSEKNQFELPILVAIATFFACVIFLSNLVISPTIHDYSDLPTFGPLYWVYTLTLVLFIVLSIIRFLRKLRMSDGIHHWQIKMMLWGILISGIAGITSDLILPVVGIQYSAIGSLLSIVWLGFSYYIVRKR